MVTTTKKRKQGSHDPESDWARACHRFAVQLRARFGVKPHARPRSSELEEWGMAAQDATCIPPGHDPRQMPASCLEHTAFWDETHRKVRLGDATSDGTVVVAPWDEHGRPNPNGEVGEVEHSPGVKHPGEVRFSLGVHLGDRCPCHARALWPVVGAQGRPRRGTFVGAFNKVRGMSREEPHAGPARGWHESSGSWHGLPCGLRQRMCEHPPFSCTECALLTIDDFETQVRLEVQRIKGPPDGRTAGWVSNGRAQGCIHGTDSPAALPQRGDEEADHLRGLGITTVADVRDADSIAPWKGVPATTISL